VSPTEALHTAARRYCADRDVLWTDRYAALQAQEAAERRRRGVREPTTYSYSADALDTFPRYQVLQAIQWAVEAFTPADFASLGDARELLAAAAETAESIFTGPPNGKVERHAMGEERRLSLSTFADYPRTNSPRSSRCRSAERCRRRRASVFGASSRRDRASKASTGIRSIAPTSPSRRSTPSRLAPSRSSTPRPRRAFVRFSRQSA
jgi:hypothetical protein